ncbi:hypothetical protein [Leptolyngbya sp. FACHB-17]|nr:hypothetical protein [Leptolyngbya sp. FACHB-17]MBD2080439.1 hypothetical protein [Leptolyngbya sp. FACHB-17]
MDQEALYSLDPNQGLEAERDQLKEVRLKVSLVQALAEAQTVVFNQHVV